MRRAREFVVARDEGTAMRLVLDGTGPRVTRHLPYIAALGEGALDRFGEVHAFSGGVYAWLIHRARVAGGLRHEVAHYHRSIDRLVRVAHHSSARGRLALLRALAARRPLYADAPYMVPVRETFADDFLTAPIASVAPTLVAWAGYPGSREPRPLPRETSVEETLRAALRVPFLYAATPDATHDAVYAPGYLVLRRRLIGDTVPTLLLTLWPTRTASLRSSDADPRRHPDSPTPSSPSRTAVVLLDGWRRPRYAIGRDVAGIILNVPNRGFRRDILAAYGPERTPGG